MGNQSKKRYYPKSAKKSDDSNKPAVNVEKKTEVNINDSSKPIAKKSTPKRKYHPKNKNGVQVKTVVDSTFKNKETYIGEVKVDMVRKPIQKETATNIVETSFEVKEEPIQKEVSHKLESIQVSETTKDSNYGVHFINTQTKTTTWNKLVSRIKKWIGK